MTDPPLSHNKTNRERERDEAEKDEPCLSVRVDRCPGAAVSDSSPQNMIPLDKRGSNDR